MITSIKYSELINIAQFLGISIEDYLEELRKDYPEIEIIDDKNSQ